MENLPNQTKLSKVLFFILCAFLFLFLAWRVVLHIERLERNSALVLPIVVTIPEGFDLNQIADTSASKLPDFNKSKFFLEAENMEGYLFPDTYFFSKSDNENDVIQLMTENFSKKISPLLPDIKSSGKSEKEIIVMASIIEREAKVESDRENIAGILWKRIVLGIPLEVDAAPETYKIKGLPESPIDNPGILAIEVAIHPKSSPYLYYLYDRNGNIHYAETFAEHEANIKKYLQ